MRRAEDVQIRIVALFQKTNGKETVTGLRREMNESMEAGAGIYRREESLRETCERLRELRGRYAAIQLEDRPSPDRDLVCSTNHQGSAQQHPANLSGQNRPIRVTVPS